MKKPYKCKHKYKTSQICRGTGEIGQKCSILLYYRQKYAIFASAGEL